MKSRARLKSMLNDGKVTRVLELLRETAARKGAATTELERLLGELGGSERSEAGTERDSARKRIVLRAHVLVDQHEDPVPPKLVLWIKEHWLLGSIIVSAILLLQGIASFTGYTVRDMLDGNDGLEEQTRPTPSTMQGVSDTSSALPSEPGRNATIRPADPMRDADGDIAPPRTDTIDTATDRITTEPSVTNPKSTTNTPTGTLPNNGRLTVRCRTEADHGQTAQFAEGDTVRCYFSVDQPCYARFLYRFEDGTIVLLAPDRKVTQAETGRDLLIKYPGFKVAAPFGEEQLYVFAQDEPFAALTTRPYPGDTEYDQVMDGLPKTLGKTRGLKPLGQRAEDALNIVTSKRQP